MEQGNVSYLKYIAYKTPVTKYIYIMCIALLKYITKSLSHYDMFAATLNYIMNLYNTQFPSIYVMPYKQSSNEDYKAKSASILLHSSYAT